MTPIGGWDVEADQLVEQTRALRLIHPASIELQRLLVESMSSVLALARGDRSEAARSTVRRREGRHGGPGRAWHLRKRVDDVVARATPAALTYAGSAGLR